MNISSQPSHNDELIQKLSQIVLDNLDNEQFGVNELAEKFGMNRSHLYRKVVVLTKKSLSQFIREIRLSEAFKLLKEESVTVSEAAYRVGFNNPSYFNSCFHDHYGFPPGEAKQRSLENTPQYKKREEKHVIPNAWRIATYLSFVVIIGLVVMITIDKNRQIRPGEIQSVLILPYKNYTGDDQLEAIISGMHAALINDLGRIITVMSKTTSDVYKYSDKTLSQIATECGVDAIVEPAVTRLGDSIFFQLKISNPEEEQLWIAEYSDAKSQIPNIHNRITKQIADELKIELTADQVSLLAESRKIDPDAIDAYLKGLPYLDSISWRSLQTAEGYFNQAIKIEPDWPPPYAGLARVVVYQNQMGMISPSFAIPKMYENLSRALELDPNSSLAHSIKAVIAVWTEWNWEKGEEEFIKSLELNPSHAQSRMFYGHLLIILHRSDEAIYQANLALKLDPQNPFILGLYGCVMIYMGTPESAIPHLKKALSINPNHLFSRDKLCFAYGQIGDYKKWFEEWKKLTWFDDDALASVDSVFQEQGYFAAVEMIIKIDEEPANEKRLNCMEQARNFLAINKCDKAMDWLEIGYEIHNPNMPYISTKRYETDQLRENPRYIVLLKKMKLPLPEN